MTAVTLCVQTADQANSRLVALCQESFDTRDLCRSGKEGVSEGLLGFLTYVLSYGVQRNVFENGLREKREVTFNTLQPCGCCTYHQV